MKNTHTKPLAVLFDWDNTLVDTEKTSFHALSETLKAFKKPALSFNQFVSSPQYSIRHMFAIIFEDQALEAEKFFKKKLLQDHLDQLHPFPKAEQLIQHLYKQKIYLAVVSNKHGDLLRQEVKALGWQTFFAEVIGSRDTPEDKPSPVPLLKALAPSGLKPSKSVWFVGDSSVDTLCAHHAGCTSVAIGPHAFVDNIPSIKAENCGELLAFFTQTIKKSSQNL